MEEEQVIDFGSTPYDDVFRTLVVDHKQILLSFINEMFPNLETKYTGDEKVLPLNGQYQQNRQDGEQDKRITDSAVMVIDHFGNSRIFHLECQSEADGSIIVRMFEYDMQIALKTASGYSEGRLKVRVPDSGVLFLRCNSNTPDEMEVELELPNGKSVTYSLPILKLKSYTVDDIFEKKLFVLVPFYLFNLENRFAKIEKGDEKSIREFRSELLKLRQGLEKARDRQEINEYVYKSLIDLFNKVNTAISNGKQKVYREAEAIMGGKVLDYEAKTIFNEGISHGSSKQISEDIKNLAEYLEKTDPSMTHESAIAAAESILKK